MIIARPILGFLSLILIAGACLLLLLTLLGGAIDHNPTNRYYFLQADTSGIAGAADQTRWTLWNACSVLNGKNSCPKVHAAYPFNPPGNFKGSEDGIPPQFVGTHYYYYMTRFMFSFILIALFFAVVALFLGLLALCTKFGSYLDSAIVSVALFFQSIAAALMTTAFVKGRNLFRSNNRTASLGKYNFGFMWAAAACLFLATVFFLCAGGAAGGSSSSSGGSRFGKKKSSKRANKNRGSFLDRSSFETKMLTRRLVPSSNTLSSSIRALSTTPSYQRTPALADVTPNNAPAFDKRQTEFREQSRRAAKQKQEQDSQSVTSSASNAQQSLSNGRGSATSPSSSSYSSPLNAETLGSLSTHATGKERDSSYQQESSKRQSSLSNLIYGTQEGQQMDQDIEKSFSQVLARGKYVHSIVFHSVKPDKVDEYVDLVGKWYPKMAGIENNHVNLVGSWRTEVGDCDTFGTESNFCKE
ncbi:uncharacterized protein KY384_001182 [Bacidia gigantensis]|uniref:uncharacterized protein n=1 Tax=Bacidia gigantensis TaxID=2732470 RepID=UPI001D05608A|nr:uncharacterized protein KY384_001182 [Bacidia gigantensis]KAG8534338.1 hypothetical protein KY384_001182 [Bacidia gigantensis]